MEKMQALIPIGLFVGVVVLYILQLRHGKGD